jgi:hypothetical protein
MLPTRDTLLQGRLETICIQHVRQFEGQSGQILKAAAQ